MHAIHEITIATKADPHALLMAAARAGYVMEQVRIDGQPTDVGPYREAGLRAQTPAGPAKAAVPVPDDGEPAITGNEDTSALAGLDFASDNAAEAAAKLPEAAVAVLRTLEPSGKTGLTTADVRTAKREAEKDGE